MSTARLLLWGAGILQWDGRAVTDPHFNFRSPKAAYAANKLVTTLAALAAAGKRCSYVVLFEDRPATLELGRRFAGELSRLWQRPVGVLSIARDGWRTIFKYYAYYPDASSSVMDLEKLTTETAQELLANRDALLFTDLLRGADHEGIIRVAEKPAVKRHGVHLVGLATLAVAEKGARRRIRQATGDPEFRTYHLLHFEETFEPPAPSKETSTGVLEGFFSRIFRHAAV